MQLRPRNKLRAAPELNIYRDTKRKGDRPRSWSLRGSSKRMSGRVTKVPVSVYLKDQEPCSQT